MAYVIKMLYDYVEFIKDAGGHPSNIVTDQILFDKNEDVKNMYYLISGDIKIVSITRNEEALIIDHCKEGRFIAPNSLFNAKYEFTAQAYTRSKIMIINAELFREALKERIDILHQICIDLSQDILLCRKKIEILGERTVRERLRKWKILNNEFPQRGGLHILANELAVSREALYREVKALSVIKS